MDTVEKYRGDEFYVVMAGERPPEFVRRTMGQRDGIAVGRPAKERHYLGEQPPVDGWVHFYDPDLLDAGEPFRHGTFPFRDHHKDGLWVAKPDAEKWSQHPIWKWKNPDADPHEELTLKPSIGMQSDGETVFHCWIENGSIRWV